MDNQFNDINNLQDYEPNVKTWDDLVREHGKEGAMQLHQDMQTRAKLEALREKQPDHPKLPENRIKRIVAEHKKTMQKHKDSFKKLTGIELK